MAIVILVVLGTALVSAQTFSITVQGNITDWALTPGIDNIDTGTTTLTVVASDPAPWSVIVKDGNDEGKPSGHEGSLVEYNITNSGYVSNPRVLASPIKVMGYGGTGLTNSTVTLGQTSQPIETGTTSGTFGPVQIAFVQTVTYSDPHLKNGNLYKITVTFTGGYN